MTLLNKGSPFDSELIFKVIEPLKKLLLIAKIAYFAIMNQWRLKPVNLWGRNPRYERISYT